MTADSASPLAERFFVSLVFATIGTILSSIVFVMSLLRGVEGVSLFFAMVASVPVALVNAILGSVLWRGSRMIESWLLASLAAGSASFAVGQIGDVVAGFIVIEIVGLGSLVLFSRFLPPRSRKL